MEHDVLGEQRIETRGIPPLHQAVPDRERIDCHAQVSREAPRRGRQRHLSRAGGGGRLIYHGRRSSSFAP
ncbi:MAG: hypothetical protein NVS9B10_17770 [Nevskia sp.]